MNLYFYTIKMFFWQGVEYPNYTFEYTTNQLISHITNKPLAISTNQSGYKYYKLSKYGKPKIIQVHRLIYFMYHPLTNFDLTINHKDHNVANNSLSNLELATYQQQQCYRRKTIKKKSSKYIGVNWRKDINKWSTKISINHKQKHIGLFDSQREAAIAYNNYIINNNLNDGFRILNIIEPKKKPVITIKN